MLTYINYLLALAVLAMLVCRTWQIAASSGLSPLVTTGIVVSALIYLSCLIPGALGLFYPPAMYGMYYGFTGALLWLTRRYNDNVAIRIATPSPATLRRGNRSIADNNLLEAAEPKTQIYNSPYHGLDGLVLAFAVVRSVPLIRYLRYSFTGALLDPNTLLGWDPVSYHLPGYIEYLQAGTLWSFSGPYQSYSFGFELIGNFFSHPFHAHWGPVLTHVFALVLLATAIIAIVRELYPLLPRARTGGWPPFALLAVALTLSTPSLNVSETGKNDIFMAACVVSSLYFLLMFRPTEGLFRRNAIAPLLLSALALGLAFGAKPTALAFVPFLGVGIAVKCLLYKQGWRRTLIASALVCAVSVLLGGFWLLRNYMALGTISPVEDGWALSLVANLRNPALYALSGRSLSFAIALTAILPGCFLIVRALLRMFSAASSEDDLINESVGRPSAGGAEFGILTLFLITAAGAFALTPHAVFHEDLNSAEWKLRLGLPLFAASAIIYSLIAAWICNVWAQRSAGFRKAVTAGAGFIFLAALPLAWMARPLTGLPSYEEIKGLPKTDIYRWVQSLPEPQRIYSAGLRPYGLYGKTWNNWQLYDGHSVALEPLETGIARINEVIDSFNPDLILISVDPHEYTGPPRKPEVVEWMRAQGGLFKLVFEDETVSAFGR